MLAFALFILILVITTLVALKIASQAFSHQHLLAQANDLVSQAAQISMAIRIFRSDGHLIEEYLPETSVDDQSSLILTLEEKGYLSDVPAPLGGGRFSVVMRQDVISDLGAVSLEKVITAGSDGQALIGDKLCAEINRRATAQFGCVKGSTAATNFFWYRFG
jgi:hypothetical protein